MVLDAAHKRGREPLMDDQRAIITRMPPSSRAAYIQFVSVDGCLHRALSAALPRARAYNAATRSTATLLRQHASTFAHGARTFRALSPALRTT